MSPGSSARLYLNTPHIGGTATIATSVNRDCLPLGPNDFESFTNALAFGAGLNISLEGNSSGDHFPNGDKIFLNKGFPFSNLPTMDKPKCMIFADDNPANVVSGGNAIAALLPAATGTLLAASAAIPAFNIPGIESHYSAHRTLPTSVNYTQMLMVTTVPDDIKAAVEQAAAPPHKHHSKVGAIVGGVIGSLEVVMLVVIGIWYLHLFGGGGLPKTGPALTPGSQMEGKDYISAK
ncbi:hypothetical protein B0H10DRAFT_1941905 [Mycena sp. CBHHK59/15]|nr:hypothetical protein B0H10DRAFT_1941905 [Mycena sp. CBHHK59/15]